MTSQRPLRFNRLAIRPLVLLLTAIGATAPGARAFPPGLGDAVPADAVAVVFNAGSPNQERGSNLRATFDVAANVLARASGVGLLSRVDPETRGWIEVLVSLPVIFKHPHALVLLDVHVAPLSDGGHKLARLGAALIVDAGGPDAAIDQRIQHFLSTFTNKDEAKLQQTDRPEGTIYTLRDRRLHSWAVIQWGRFENRYVVTIGEGAMDKVLETAGDPSRSLTLQAWFARAFAAVQGGEAAAGCYVRFNALVQDEDRGFAAKVDAVRAALNLDATEQALWTMRYRQRAVEITGFLRRDGNDAVQSIATAGFPTGVSANVVPDPATGYTVVTGNPRRLFHGLCDAYLAARDRDRQLESRTFWRGVERQAGVSVEEDIFPHLSAPIVIHDHPKHVLRLPFTWTVITRVHGNPEVLRDRIDKLLAATASTYFETVAPKLRRHPDGVWSIDLGISGPALAVTDEWLILSYSPYAVRENIAWLQALHNAPADLVDRAVLGQTEPRTPPSP